MTLVAVKSSWQASWRCLQYTSSQVPWRRIQYIKLIVAWKSCFESIFLNSRFFLSLTCLILRIAKQILLQFLWNFAERCNIHSGLIWTKLFVHSLFSSCYTKLTNLEYYSKMMTNCMFSFVKCIEMFRNSLSLKSEVYCHCQCILHL